MRGFDDTLSRLVAEASPESIHEIGCGEGFWVLSWRRRGIAARGSDCSLRVIEIARANGAKEGLAPELFEARSIYDLRPERDSADLVVCAEVLEHLDRPEEGLRALQRVAKGHLIVSVPREPLWRLLNVARGKYLGRFGNTPGHLQHWSHDGFVRLVARYFDILEVRTPFPWTMLLCRARR
jgi:2-polyprenyl-3-methyl-5-hydroxy-6-metoxy-1,4-benzoquinol methylase